MGSFAIALLLAPASALTTGKLWTLKTFLRDHVTFAGQIPNYLGAYVSPGRAIAADVNEAVMCTMNSVNTCPYCTGLHGQLARMASAPDPSTSSAAEVVFARVFAEEAGRGEKLEKADTALVSAVGAGKAASTRALCWFLLWGKTTGNTINDVRSKLLAPKLPNLFELCVLCAYGPLFAVIGALNLALTKAPKVPPKVSAAIGACLWLPQALHVGIIGLLSFVPAKILSE